MARKTHRRFIKINGHLVGSPEFETKGKADAWYREQRERREAMKRMSSEVPTFLEYSAKFMKRMVAAYDKPTWSFYETNLRIYLLPALKEYKMNEITRGKARDVLGKIGREYGIAKRRKCQTTLSRIFSDAINEEPPLRPDNPCSKLKIEGKRQSTKYIPATLASDDEVAEILRAAHELGDEHFVLVCLGVMSALRKSEMISLQWTDIARKQSEIHVRRRYRQAMKVTTDGTKAGENTSRVVPVSQALLDVLIAHEWRVKDRGPYILSNAIGSHLSPRQVHDMFDAVRRKIGRPDLTLHSLRHTYGRLFTLKTGNTKALQTILGHASPVTTALYSELAGSQVKPFAELMSFECRQVLRPQIRTTQKRHKKGSQSE